MGFFLQEIDIKKTAKINKYNKTTKLLSKPVVLSQKFSSFQRNSKNTAMISDIKKSSISHHNKSYDYENATKTSKKKKFIKKVREVSKPLKTIFFL